MFQLLKLTLRERRWVILAFAATIFVSLFTYVFVDLVQPILDDMLQLAPQGGAASAPGATMAAPQGAAAVPRTARALDILWNFLHISPQDIKNVLPFVLVVVIFGKGLFTFLASLFMKIVGNKIVKTMRDELYAHILGQSSAYFDRATTGDLMSRLTNDVDRIRDAVSSAMSDIIEEACILVALLVGMFVKDWTLALSAFVIMPLAVLPLAAFSRQLKSTGRLSQLKMSEIYDILHETITGNRIVKAFTMEAFELRKFLKATAKYFRINVRLSWISSLSSPFMEFIGGVVGAFILYIGSRRIAQSHISPGDFGAFATAIFMMFQPIKRLSRANNVIQQAVPCLDRIQEVLQMPSEVQDKPDAYPLPPIQGRVAFEKVGFAYVPGRPVLFDVSFEVPARTTAALVGLSGAGKSTLINLLSRFYEPDQGRITVDGIDVTDITLRSLRSQIGLVTQDIVLFNDTVRNNIAYGLEDVSEERLRAAAQAAECHRFICDLPQGYDTPIGERGGQLSRGQRQRLAIARALLKNPPILILDEATSALDSESERLIQAALAAVMRGRTTIVIAHRLSTIRSADRILVIDKGRIVETGPHEELMRRGGIYRKLHELQFPEEEENPR